MGTVLILQSHCRQLNSELFEYFNATIIRNYYSKMKRVAVIGAGAAGLSSARHLIAAGFHCCIYETAPDLGGTWLYTNDVGKDKYGYPVYSAMYQGLRTNLPKEVMGFPDFPILGKEKSYLSQQEILDFLNLYADHFEIRKRIKFNHHVIDVSPLADDKWSVTSMDKPRGTKTTEVYDAVMVCNGHYNDPVYPDLKGRQLFKGQQMHSQHYRKPGAFTDQRTLVIGAGPSGLDLALQISKVAKKVTLSHHSVELKSTFPSNIQLKPNVDCILNATEIRFDDGTVDQFDCILYCTGYKYCFPFLSDQCGITTEDNHIKPLFKHMINIEKPTMCFIGIPFGVCAFQMFDLQARYFVASLSGEMKIPSKEEMYADREQDLIIRKNKGYSLRQAHLMGPDQSSYYQILAEEANTAPIPPVIVKLRDESEKCLFDDLINFRNNNYRIVDDNNFVKVN